MRLVMLALLFVQLTKTTIISTKKFFPAIYEPAITIKPDRSTNVSRKEAISIIRKRLDKYTTNINSLNSFRLLNILVLPEYGLLPDMERFTRQSITNFLDSIPDPTKIQPWIPCDNPGLYPNTEIQKYLSCMARKTGLYIVTNVGDRQNCSRTKDPNCPTDGRYQYNTNVVYSSNGTLVARYHKKHLFSEPYFNSPPTADYAVFDTPFGRFATIVSSDILFKDTLIDLIEKHKVRNILFPNYWFDIPPLFLSIPFHASIAKTAKINLISANMNLQGKYYGHNQGGSGIYTPTQNSVFGNTEKTNSLLWTIVNNLKEDYVPSFPWPPKRVLPKSDNPKVKSTSMFNMYNFNTVTLLKQKGVVSVCEQGACCALEYEFYPNRTSESEANYILAAGNQEIFFSNNKDAVNTQSCVLCPVNNETLQCLQTLPENVTKVETTFRKLKMYTVNFSTPYFFQQMNSFEGRFTATNTGDKGQIDISEEYPWLHSAVILGRLYSGVPRERPSHGNGTTERPRYGNGTTEIPTHGNGTTERPTNGNGTTERPTHGNGTTHGPPSGVSYTYTISVYTLLILNFISGYLLV